MLLYTIQTDRNKGGTRGAKALIANLYILALLIITFILILLFFYYNSPLIPVRLNHLNKDRDDLLELG